MTQLVLADAWQVVYHTGRRGGRDRRYHPDRACAMMHHVKDRRILKSRLGSMLAAGRKACSHCGHDVVQPTFPSPSAEPLAVPA